MKFNFRLSRIQRIGLALLALIGAGLACEAGGVNVPPDNPTLQAITVVEGLTFTQYVEQLGVLPAQNIAPWIISPIPPPQGGATITFSGWGPTQADLNSTDVPTIVLYEVLPDGCDNPLSLGRKLGMTNSTSHNWEIPNIEIASEIAIVGAVVEYDGIQGPLGNFFVLNEQKARPRITKPENDATSSTGYVDVAGEALSRSCIRLQVNGRFAGQEEVKENGQWAFSSISLDLGQNDLKFELRGIPLNIPTITITNQAGFTVDTDLNKVVDVTGCALDAAIKSKRADSPLIGLGQVFVDVGNEEGINSIYIAAHAAWESAWGTTRLAQDKNNLFGFKAYDRCPYECAETFATKEDGVRTVMQYVKQEYLTETGKYYNGPTLRGMNVKYATDKNWRNGIASIMNSLYNFSKNYVCQP